MRGVEYLESEGRRGGGHLGEFRKSSIGSVLKSTDPPPPPPSAGNHIIYNEYYLGPSCPATCSCRNYYLAAILRLQYIKVLILSFHQVVMTNVNDIL